VKRNPWASANKVFVGYCSSDAYVGDSETWFASGIIKTFVFRGQRILTSLLAQLNADFGLASATRIVFGGCSEGGRGAMASIDYLMPLFPAGADVRGLFDSAFELDMDVFDVANAATSLQNQTAMALVFLNATARMGVNCYTAFGDTVLGWRCLYGQYRLGFLNAKWLASFSQFDSAQLVLAEGAPPPYGTAALAYADRFQQEVRFQALQLPGAQQSGSAVFSSACFHHCSSNSGSFWGIHVDGASLASYAGAWFFGGNSAMLRELANQPQVIESCNGLGCGQCHAPPTAVPNPPLPPARLGLRASAPPPPPPPLGALSRALGLTPASQQSQQQKQQAKEQALDDTASGGYTELQLRTFHFFLFMLGMFALLAARLACRAARPVPLERRNGGYGGGGAAGSRSRSGAPPAELTPLLHKQGDEDDFGVFGASALELGAGPTRGMGRAAGAPQPPPLAAVAGGRFTRVAPVSAGS
jgi:hypothetical protein